MKVGNKYPNIITRYNCMFLFINVYTIYIKSYNCNVVKYHKTLFGFLKIMLTCY